MGSLLAIDAAAEAIVCEGTALEVRPVQTAYLLTTALIRGSVLCSGEAKMTAALLGSLLATDAAVGAIAFEDTALDCVPSRRTSR